MRTKKVETSSEPLLLTPNAAARKLGIGVVATRDLLRHGEIRTVTVGKREMVTAASLGEWIKRASHVVQTPKAPAPTLPDSSIEPT